MKLADAQALYIQQLQARGCAGTSIAGVLRMFAKSIGGERELETILTSEVRTFLDGTRPLTRYWHRKHSALLGFFRFAFVRSMVAHMPLPMHTPRCRQVFRPYIYTDDDVARLIGAIDSLRTSRIERYSLRTLLVLLLGTGLRLSEALHLTLADVDLEQNLLIVRESKFYKTRLVPIGPDLVRILCTYVDALHPSRGADPASPLLVCRDGEPLTGSGTRRAFARLRSMTGLRRNDDLPNLPRLHDFRASFAVRRLTAWYREGADVQKLLPLLSTYLGHVSIAATQVYLPLTPELLVEASARFERYATLQGDQP
ncbi:tyrosine-type recombinase/integrase [Hydrogenophaga pseudoflava]|uniref:Tyrosine recombinase XerD n=1 Tax=Hydrogenophaga pseudoflava TaxID=47421 RepID=A0A4P6WYB1_HYDPS|nr:tyrosine-type recombinase/integrase [Hydrogenophaga pseudoflava]MCM2337297.1 tyrosine-type recombinase/integrase [Lysobacter sp.]QBM28687.1 Tyrosine recombinase XerD [Hydrogenophaga pseudoflava]